MSTAAQISSEIAVSDRISDEAKRLLVAASEVGGEVFRVGMMGGVTIQAGHRRMNKMNDRRDEARWEAAIEELVRNDLLEPRGSQGNLFAVTHRGSDIVEIVKAQLSPLQEETNS